MIEPGPVTTKFLKGGDPKGYGDAQEDDDVTKSLMNKLGQWFKRLGSVSQSGEDIAKYILKAMEDESPHLHYITNATWEEMIKKKFIDITGDSIVKSTAEQFFSS